MLKKEKKANSGMATKRLKDLLDDHIQMLTGKNRTFQVMRDEGYYLEQRINPDNPDDTVKIGYTMQKKLLTRSFCLEFRTVVNDIHFSENFLLKLNFAGFPHTNTVFFKGKKESEKYAESFNKPQLLEKLKRTAGMVDIDFITIEYSKSRAAFTIRISPIPGGAIWIVFPPVFFKMKLKQEEIDALWRIMIDLRKHIETCIVENNWK